MAMEKNAGQVKGFEERKKKKKDGLGSGSAKGRNPTP